MIHVFDANSIRSLQHIFPSVFKTIWGNLESLVQNQQLISTREAFNELERQNLSAELMSWVKGHKTIFTTPSAAELQFVADIFKVNHFQTLIGAQQRLKGTPVADPFVIACAKIRGGTVVTEEGWLLPKMHPPTPKPNAAKIPNVCAHFNVPCIDLETFMQQQGWKF